MSDEAKEAVEELSFQLELPPSSVFVPTNRGRLKTRMKLSRPGGKGKSMENPILITLVAFIIVLGGYILFRELAGPKSEASQAKAVSEIDGK
ncbi:hypothetical protein ACFL1X_10315 [Candidatus Hydrogenedentota bacterium]